MVKVDDTYVFGNPIDQGALMQILLCAKKAEKSALMADHHKGYAVPIGGVLAYDGLVSPSGVGFDIACGNKAVQTNLTIEDFEPQWFPAMANAIWEELSFGIGQKNNTKVDHELFDSDVWKLPSCAPLKTKAQEQLGTIGSGNHFVDVFKGAGGRVWVGVHFGSRGFGHGVATYYLKAGGAKDGMDVEPLLLSDTSDLGIEYIEAMKLAGEYAYAGRDWVCNKVLEILGADEVKSVHNHHNFAWQEEGLWVVRKGATPNVDGQLSFVGGSMGDPSYILRGVRSWVSPYTLGSTVHGAGRAMSRSQAKKTIDPLDMGKWILDKGVELSGGGLDESPQSYKRIDEVLEHHADTILVEEALEPIIVCMAGPKDHDPYRD